MNLENGEKYSGGEINKNKTRILNINGTIEKDLEILCVYKIKILGVKFDRNGISNSNVKEIFNKIVNNLKIS